MNKKLKIALVIFVVVFLLVILDTIQARVFKHNPIISFKEELEDSDSFAFKGILMDTYYCTKERDIVTIYFKSKTSKFTCPIE